MAPIVTGLEQVSDSGYVQKILQIKQSGDRDDSKCSSLNSVRKHCCHAAVTRVATATSTLHRCRGRQSTHIYDQLCHHDKGSRVSSLTVDENADINDRTVQLRVRFHWQTSYFVTLGRQIAVRARCSHKSYSVNNRCTDQSSRKRKKEEKER